MNTQPPRAPRRPYGFSLIELMTVVAIAAIMASIAAPAGIGFLVRARRAERTAMITGLRRSLEIYFQGSNQWMNISGTASNVNSAFNPVDTPWTAGKKPFVSSMASWNQLAFAPEGYLFYSYQFSGSAVANGAADYYMVTEGDVDNDGVVAVHTEHWTLQGDGSFYANPNTDITDVPSNTD